MTKQEKLAKEKEEEVAKALKGSSDEQVLNAIQEGTIKKALEKKASTKKAPAKGKKVDKEKAPKVELYKASIYGVLSKPKQKAFRTSTRKLRNKKLSLIISLHNDKKVKEKGEAIKDFLSFYKERYALNDLSPLSLQALNSDDDTKKMIEEGLRIIKASKIK